MSDTVDPGHSATTRRPGASRPKVPPFARYEGTSAWRKDRRKVRAYARYFAEANKAKPDHATPSA